MDYLYAPWSRNDKKRIYVKRVVDDVQLGFLDTNTLQHVPERECLAGELAVALAALTGAPAQEIAAPAAPSQVPLPWHDLASNPPGHTLSGTANANYESGVIGEQRTAATLHPLLAAGWRVAHGVPLSPTKDIDHLLVGPAGVFAVNSKHTSYAVTLTANSIRVDAHVKPWLDSAIRDAHIAGRYLSDALRMPITPQPLIAVWALMGSTGTHPQALAGDQLVGHLAQQPEIYPPAWVDVVFSTARRSDTWTVQHQIPAA